MFKDKPPVMGRIQYILVLALICWLPASQARDACLERPWQEAGAGTAQTVSVSLAAFEELQQHIDKATGPTTFVIKPKQPKLVANRPVQISKPDITITAAAEFLSSDSSDGGLQLPVDCAPAGSLLQIRAPGFRLLGLDISGCSSSAVQLVGAKRALIRSCAFSNNVDSSSSSAGGAAVSASKSQLWLDASTFKHNSAAAGPGGALAATASQLLVTGCSFTSNEAGQVGGAIALQGRTDAAIAASSPACWKDVDGVLQGVKLRRNSAALHGGALATNSSHVVLQGSSASGNSARYGGVVYAGQAANVAIRASSSMTNNSASSSGGVVYALGPGVKVMLQASTFAANRAEILGGVLSAKDAASVKLDGCTFSSNSAKLAAGVLYARDADLTASTCTFSSNTAARDGGALYCAGNCNWSIKGSTFTDNECAANGGALFGWNLAATISSSRLDSNSAGALGGAVSVANSTLSMHSCKLGTNSAYGSDAAGGGVYSQGSQLNVTDCSLSGNVASWGGAVYVTNSTLALNGGSIANSSVSGSGAAVYVLRSPTSLVNVTLSGNDAEQYGGSLYCHYSACSMTGCDVSYDSASLGAGCVWVSHGSVSLRGSHFMGCIAATEGGGGVMATSALSVSVVGCSFTGCSALKGAGGGLELDNVAAAQVKGSLFAANQAMTGGSISTYNSTVSISGSSLLNSTATVGGCIAASGGSSITLFNGTAVAGNAAAVGGGLAIDNTSLSLTGPIAVSWNKALQPPASSAPSAAAGMAAAAAAPPPVKPTADFGGQAVLRGIGGGIYAHASKVLGSGLRLERNAADRVGGGGYWDRSGVKLSRSSISKNTAGEEAGGLKLVNPAHGSSLTGCVVAANWAGVRAGGLGIVGIDLVSEVALVGVALVNNTAAAEAAGGLLLSGPLGLLMVGGEVSGNAAGAAAVTDYSSSDPLAAAASSFESYNAGGGHSAGLAVAGGGMLLDGCSWAALRGVDVWGNAAPSGCGGGVAVSSCAKFMLDGAVIEGNVAASGGGVCITGIPGYLTIHNSSISSNRALLGGIWGGLGSTLSPTPEPHLSCRVPGTGGGLCVESQGQVLINGSTISRNQARNGGAMALGVCDDSERCSLGLFGATFTNNTAVQGGGGAVYFTSAVAPDQVLCGEDYNTSAAMGYTAGTTFPSLATLLSGATFSTGSSGSSVLSSNSTAAAATETEGVPASSSNSSGTGSSSSGGSSSSDSESEDDVIASTPGSAGGSSTFTPGGSSSSSEDVMTETVSFDPAAGSSTTTATTVTFGSQPGMKKASTTGKKAANVLDVSGMRVSNDGSSSSSSATTVEMGSPTSSSSVSGDGLLTTTTESFDPSSGPVTATTVSFDPAAAATPAAAAATEAFDPAAAAEATTTTASYDPAAGAATAEVFDPAAAAAAAQAVSFDASSDASTTTFLPESAPANFDDETMVGFDGFDPSAAGSTADTAEFGIASAPDAAAAAANQQQPGAVGAAEAAFQQQSAQAAAAAGPGQEQLRPESGQYGLGQRDAPHTIPNDMGTLDFKLGDATEALQVLKPPKERTFTFAVGSGLTASTTVFVNAAADAAVADAVLDNIQGGDGSSSTSETPGMQPVSETLNPAGNAEADSNTLRVPVTLQLLMAAQKAGVPQKATNAWRQAGTVRLEELLEAGVVNEKTLSQYWSPVGGLVPPQQQPKRSKANAEQQDLYVALAVALSEASAAAAGTTRSGPGSMSSVGGDMAWDWGSGFNPYTMTCDPVQNPAACPVPKNDKNVKQPKGKADANTAKAAAAAAALAATGSPGSSNAAYAGIGGSAGSAAVVTEASMAPRSKNSNPNGRRRLMEIDEAAAAQEAAAAVEAAVAAAGQVSRAPSTGLLLQGTSQCGTFENNTAIGAKSYGPVVTSRPAGLRVWDSSGDLTGPNPVSVATGGQVQVQIQVVDVFGGVVTSGAADYIRVRATLENPNGGAAAALPHNGGASSSRTAGTAASVAAAVPGLSPAVATDEESEVDAKGVVLSGLQQLSTSNGSLILSGLRLSGPPGTNTTLYFKASDPSLLPASVPVSLTSCSAGYMQLPGSCQLCPSGTYSFSPDEPRCILCPAGASCNGTVVVPQSGYWHSGPRSAQIHACLNPAACARDAVRKQQLVEWQARNYGQGLILGKSKDAVAEAVGQYMQEQCAAGYTGAMCANCAQDPAAVAANRVSHGKVAGSCVTCGDRRTVLGMYVLARLYDLALWAALTWLAWRAAKAWAKAVTCNPATAAATAGSLPPSSAAAGSLSARVGGGEKGSYGMVLATSAAAAAAAAGVGTSAPLHAHVSVFLDYLQMLSIISFSVASYSWPKMLQTFMSGFGFVPLGTSKWVSAECLLPFELSYRRSIVGLLLTAALPLFYLGTSAGVWIAGLMMGKTHRTPILALVVGTGLFYPLITMSALNAFSCHYIDSPRVGPGEVVSAPGSYWALDPELKCYEGQHLQLMLGFGLPVVLLVVLAWPLLLASMLWDSRFRIREQQQHPATRRRYLVRKTIKLCHQLLGVMSGFNRPKMYLWPVLVEVRKLLLCVVVVLASGSAPAVQLYVLWGLLALVLLLEWWARAPATWALVALQLVAIGALQAVVYLAAAFTQASLAGATTTFTALIIGVCLSVAVAFLLSLIAGLRGNSWLMKVLDVDNDGKISSTDLYQSASKLLHLNMTGGAGPSGKAGALTSPKDAAGGSKLVVSTGGSSRIATWRMVFAGKGGRPGHVETHAMDLDLGDDSTASPDDAAGQQPLDQVRPGGLRSPAASQAGRGSGPAGRGLAAGSLPITDASGGHGGIMASSSSGSAVAAAAAVATSASIDIGALGALRKVMAGRPGGNALLQQLQQAAASSAAVADSAGVRGIPLPPGAHVAVDLHQLSGGGSASQQQQLTPAAAAAAAAKMARANSAGASVPGNMPLQTYLSVHQWLTASEELAHAAGHPDNSGWVMRGRNAGGVGGGGGSAEVRGARASTRSLQETSSSPGPYVGGSGSLAAQRLALLQQLQNWQQQGQQQQRVAFDDEAVGEEEVDVANLRSVSETEQQLVQQQQQARSTGHAAAARADNVAAAAVPPAAAQPGRSGVGVTRHQPYYALWSNIASAIGDPLGPPAAAAAAVSPSSTRRTEPAAARASSGGPAAAGSSGGMGSGVRPSPFAAPPAAVTAALHGDPTALAAAAAAAGGMGPPVRAVSLPGKAHAPAASPFAAVAAVVAAGQVAAVPPAPPGRHSAYYNLWQSAVARLSEEGLSPVSADAEAAADAVSAALPVQEVSVQRSATAPPSRHRQYIGLWAAVAEELGDGPSAVGVPAAATAAPVIPVQVAAAVAAQQQQQPGVGRRPSPFAAMAAAAAAAAGEVQQVEQQQQRRRRRSSRQHSRPGRRSSTAGGDMDDDGAASDSSAYVGAPACSGDSQV